MNTQFIKKILIYTLVITLATLFVSCVHVPIPPKIYNNTAVVSSNGLEFELKSANFSNSFLNWVGQSTKASATFLIVEIAYTNRRFKALQSYFRPSFSLIDENGIEYEKSDQNTMMINMGRGGLGITDAINPNVEYKSKLVFDVPKQKYKRRVFVPTRSRSNKVWGDYFYFDLP